MVIKSYKLQVYQLFFIFLRRTYFTLLLLGFLVVEVVAQSSITIDSLKEELGKSGQKKRFEILFSLFREYLAVDQDKALYYASNSLDQAMKDSDSLNIVKASNARGHVLKTKGVLREAIRTFEYALGIARRNKYNVQVKFLLNNLALSNTLNASYDKALNYNFESLKIREAEGNLTDVIVTLNNIGLVYHELHDYENALLYYQKCYEVTIKNDLKFNLEKTLFNMGLVYNALGKFDKAEEKIRQGFSICEKEDCKLDVLVQANQALGTALLQQKDYKQAEGYFNKSLEISTRQGYADFIASNYRLLAQSKFEQGLLDEAIALLDNSQEVAEEADFRQQILDNYNLYALIYSSKNDFKKAADYKDRYIKLYGDIFNGDLVKNISRIQTDYEEQENIKTIAEKNQNIELSREVIRQSQILNWLLTAVILLTSVLGVVIYRNYSKIKAVNDALAIAKQIIEDQNRLLDQQVKEKTKELVDTNESLTKVNDELDNFIYKTSHDIRGPLASLKGMVNLAIMDVKDDKALGYLNKLDLTAEKLNMILTRLLIVNRINHAELKPEVIHFEPIIQEILLLEMKKGVPAKIKIDYEVDSDIQLVSDKEMVRLVLENLIDNAVKFYNESQRIESFVRISIQTEKGTVTARILDNGVGIAQMAREKIFRMFVRASERSETGGIGLYLAKLASEKLGGEINLVSTDEKYTEFIVKFPRDLYVIIEKRKHEKRKQDEERMRVEVKQNLV